MQLTLTKHAVQRAVERIIPSQKKLVRKIILGDVQNNWKDRTLGQHPAIWELTTGLAKYKIAEDGSVLTCLNH